jgi:hypothetical protein
MIEQSTTPQSRDAADAQLRIDDRHRIAAHLAGAGRVEDRLAVLAREAEQLVVALRAGPGRYSSVRKGVSARVAASRRA